MAISLQRKQQAAARAAATQLGSAHGCSKAASAAMLLKAAEVHGNVAAWEHLEDDDRTSWGGSDSGSSGGGSLEGSFHGDHHAPAALLRPKRRKGGLKGGSRTELQDVPFGMLVLEVLLDATAGEERCKLELSLISGSLSAYGPAWQLSFIW
jgi:hypothetical protein